MLKRLRWNYLYLSMTLDRKPKGFTANNIERKPLKNVNFFAFGYSEYKIDFTFCILQQI